MLFILSKLIVKTNSLISKMSHLVFIHFDIPPFHHINYSISKSTKQHFSKKHYDH